MVKLLWENHFKKSTQEGDIGVTLRTCPIFSTLSKRELNFVADIVHKRNYRPGEMIFEQNEVGVGMYVVVKGSINITVSETSGIDQSQNSIFVTRLDRGDFFGEISLVEENGRRTATATACDEVQVLGFFKPDLKDIAERNPVIGFKIVSQLCEVLGTRLHETARKVSLLKKELRNIQEEK